MFPGSKDLTGIRPYELPDEPFINKDTVIQFSNELLDFLSSDSDNKLNFSNIQVNQFTHRPAQFQNRIFMLKSVCDKWHDIGFILSSDCWVSKKKKICFIK